MNSLVVPSVSATYPAILPSTSTTRLCLALASPSSTEAIDISVTLALTPLTEEVNTCISAAIAELPSTYVLAILPIYASILPPNEVLTTLTAAAIASVSVTFVVSNVNIAASLPSNLLTTLVSNADKLRSVLAILAIFWFTPISRLFTNDCIVANTEVILPSPVVNAVCIAPNNHTGILPSKLPVKIPKLVNT